jgi:hypothetical protein
MATWAAVISGPMYATERLYHHETLAVGVATGANAAPGDPVVLVAATDKPIMFGLGRIGDGSLVEYTIRLFEAPLPAHDIPAGSATGLHRISPEAYAAAAGRISAAYQPQGARRDWHVILHLPIEASTEAAAVREFWTYVERLGPHELPAFVYPSGDELAMRAYLGGAAIDLDPVSTAGGRAV